MVGARNRRAINRRVGWPIRTSQRHPPLRHRRRTPAMSTRLQRTRQTWGGMKQRCLNPKCEQYKNYGARGITICKRWIGANGFTNFLNDMGWRPDGLTIDRIDNDGNYEPKNCRWADKATQRANCGTTKLITEWSKYLGLHESALAHRIKVGWPLDVALTSGKTHGHFGKVLHARKEQA